MAGNITEEEYEQWLLPEQALQRLGPPTSDTTKNHLISLVQDQLVRTAARHLAINGEKRNEYFTIDAKYWPKAEYLHYQFWSTALLQHKRGDDYSGRNVIRFHQVRFEPVDLLSEPSAAPGTPEKADTRKPIADAERDRFARLYLDVFGDSATEAAAYRAVQACYPEHKVSRDPFLAIFREIRGRQKPGRKGKNEKL